LTKQLLAYSGKGKFVIQPINLARLVQEMSHLLGVSVSKKVSFITKLQDDLPAIEADAVQMQQVVMNLITNASEAIGDQAGRITVRTGCAHVNRDYLADTYFDEDLPEGEYVFLEVSDTGCGIDAETKRRIFDPFFTTKFTGRGLGLAAVLGIVRGHHGAINLYSEVGHGTTFKVLLPSSEKKVSQDRMGEMERNRNWRGAGIILVIDDEEGVRIVAKSALEKAGFTILTAQDGREGLQIFHRRAGEIAAVLLDMTMPHMSGDEVYRELVRARPDVPVILSSGYNEQDATSLFVGKGLAGFIQKPYQPMALIDKVRRTLESGEQGRGDAAIGGR
jgi:CheY-like chemotaxis protein